MSIVSFPDPSKPKAFYLDRVRRHRLADELIRGTGWDPDEHRGCAVGCTLEKYDHSLYPELLGVPEQVAYLQDWLFENIPEGHELWPERFLAAIPEGADLSGVYPAWVVRLMARNLDRLGTGDEPWRTAVRASIVGVRDLFQAGMPDESAAWSAWSAAWSARSAAWSARSAEWSAGSAESARSAAWSARSAEWSAGSAESAWSARSAARSAAWSAGSAESARSAEILRQAEDLLDLLRSAPVSIALVPT